MLTIEQWIPANSAEASTSAEAGFSATMSHDCNSPRNAISSRSPGRTQKSRIISMSPSRSFRLEYSRLLSPSWNASIIECQK